MAGLTIDPTTAVGQAQTTYNNLSIYFDALNDFVSDDTGATLPPDCDATLVSLFNYDQLLTMTQARTSDVASYQNGAAIESVHTMVGIEREFGLRQKTKLDYYSDAQDDYSNESDYWDAMSVFYVSMLLNVYKEGQTS